MFKELLPSKNDQNLPTEKSEDPEILTRLLEENKPKKEFRILITGGSVAYGWGASSEQKRFSAQLEKHLREKFPGLNIHVINGGVPDFEALDELQLYLYFLRKLQPDVIVMFTGYNDLWDTVRKQLIRQPDPRLEQLAGRRVIAASETWNLFLAFLRSFIHQSQMYLVQHSKFFEFVKNEREKLEFLPVDNLSVFQYERGVDDLKTFLSSVAAFHFLARRDRIRFLVVFQPVRALTNVSQDEFPISHYEGKLRLLYKNFLRPELRKWSQQAQVPYHDFNDELVDILARKRLFIDFCHLNDEGNMLVANELSRLLEKDVLPSAFKKS